jgi:hypothetical protein
MNMKRTVSRSARPVGIPLSQNNIGEKHGKRGRRNRALLEAAFCQAADRDVAALTCGYPLPCPHHNFRRVVRVVVAIEQPAKRRRKPIRT